MEPVHVCVIRSDFLAPGMLCVQENQKRLFKEVIQFSPDVLQNGNGSGFGLWSKYLSYIEVTLPIL